MLFMYRFILFLLTPLIYIWLGIRRVRGKEDKERFAERFGESDKPRPTGNLFWFHAASIGEANSIIPLIEKLLAKYPGWHVLVTTGTVTSAKLLEGRLPARAFHQYVPVDLYGAVKKFLDHWQPDVALWVESELWPNLILETKKSGATMLLINGRLSDRSYKKWRRWKTMAREMIRCFSLCLPQTEEDGRRFISIGSESVRNIGNLKAEGKPLPAEPKAYADMINMIGERNRWLAASTHPGEEKILAELHKKLKSAHPDILTVIVPRHAVRGNEIRDMLESAGLKVVQRSREEKIEKETDVYLADTMGELGIFYRICPITFMGGSLVKHGGQNPFEPARLECAVISGPYNHNFSNIYHEMEQRNAAVTVATPDKLAFVVSRLMFDYEARKRLADNALEFVGSKAGIIDAFVREIANYAK